LNLKLPIINELEAYWVAHINSVVPSPNLLHAGHHVIAGIEVREALTD
jgi:hypothetical protein